MVLRFEFLDLLDQFSLFMLDVGLVNAFEVFYS
jgi:hypothetical protein